MKIPFKGWAIILVILCIGLGIFLLPGYVSATYEDYKETKAAKQEALEEDHWVYNSQGRRYLQANGKYIKNEWHTLDGINYRFNADGYMQTGWFMDGPVTYYLLPNGEPTSGWVQRNSDRVFLNADSSMAMGWIEDNGKHYFMSDSGKMSYGWIEEDDKKYFLGSDGSMQTGWIEDSGNSYYLKEDGTASIGWVETDNKWYYFRDDGAMTIGWITEGDNRHFMKADGSMMINSWTEQDGKRCYMKENGTPTVGWLTLDGTSYYFGEDGTVVTGWQKLDTGWYYFKKDGSMAVGWIIDETGVSFHLKENGQWDPNATNVIDPQKTPAKAPERKGKMIAITFDDGPGQYTERILNVLKQNDAKATFFVVGQNVPKYTSAVKTMADMGCEIGNHSYSNEKLTGLSGDKISSEISKTNDELRKVLGYGSSLVRPPYASINSVVKEKAAAPLILWSIDSLDWQTKDPIKTAASVLDNAKEGDIILMHDIHEETAAAVEKLIPALKEKGFQLVTVSELAAAQEVTLKNGSKYENFYKKSAE